MRTIALLIAMLVAFPLRAGTPEETIRRFEAAVEAGDGATAANLLTSSFEMIHGTGVVESRDSYLAKVRGGNLSMQRMGVTRYDVEVLTEGDAAIQRSRSRMVNAATRTELWLRSVVLLVNQKDGWKIASIQSTLLYQGAVTDPAPFRPRAGTYAVDGRGVMTLSAGDDGVIVHWPNGATQQAFPSSPTELALGRGQTLAFENGEAVYTRDGKIAWRAKKSEPSSP